MFCDFQKDIFGALRASVTLHDPRTGRPTLIKAPTLKAKTLNFVFPLEIKKTPTARSFRPAQACSLSALQSCSLISDGSVLNTSSSTTRPLRFSSRHSPSSTGRHSRRLPLSSSWVRPVSSPKRDGSVWRQLFPRFRVRSFLHLNSSGGKVSIWEKKKRESEVKRPTAKLSRHL